MISVLVSCQELVFIFEQLIHTIMKTLLLAATTFFVTHSMVSGQAYIFWGQ
jgi:hypothetical protein